MDNPYRSVETGIFCCECGVECDTMWEDDSIDDMSSFYEVTECACMSTDWVNSAEELVNWWKSRYTQIQGEMRRLNDDNWRRKKLVQRMLEHLKLCRGERRKYRKYIELLQRNRRAWMEEAQGSADKVKVLERQVRGLKVDFHRFGGN